MPFSGLSCYSAPAARPFWAESGGIMSKFILTAVTLVAIYGVFAVYGDAERRPEVTRAPAERASIGLNPGDWLTPGEAIVTRKLPPGAMSEREAIGVALDAGRAHREGRTYTPPMGALVAATEAAPVETTDALGAAMWYVTGSTVNVRAGPGTGNPVVTQVSFGDAAEVLDESGDGWLQIRPEGSDTVGWVSRRFLDQVAPG